MVDESTIVRRESIFEVICFGISGGFSAQIHGDVLKIIKLFARSAPKI